MRDWIATDLDHTLFSRAHQGPGVPGTWHVDKAGISRASSIVPAETHRLFRVLAEHFQVVAVTARDLASLRRVAIVEVPIAGAVGANGAVLLGPGQTEPDPEWTEKMDTELSRYFPAMQEICERFTALGEPAVRPRLVPSAGEFPAYLVVKASEAYWHQSAWRELLGAEAAAFFIDVLGLELQLVPRCLGKRVGLEEFQRRFQQNRPPLMAFGDAHADWSFMAQAHFAAMPRDSALARRLVDVTDEIA